MTHISSCEIWQPPRVKSAAFPNTEENYISFSKRIKEFEVKKTKCMKPIRQYLRFVDSVKIMKSSLE